MRIALGKEGEDHCAEEGREEEEGKDVGVEVHFGFSGAPETQIPFGNDKQTGSWANWVDAEEDDGDEDGGAEG